jgi:hypothetical protein
MGFSLRIPPSILKFSFSYYGSNVSAFKFTYSDVCDHLVDAAKGPPDIATPPACPFVNATSIKQVVQIMLNPAVVAPHAQFLNVLFYGVPADAVVYIGSIYYRTFSGSFVSLGPCPTHGIFPLADCGCNGVCADYALNLI